MHLNMHRALLLPEIVAAILRSEAATPGFIHTCLFINRLFSLEATRMLWKGCGDRYTNREGFVTPYVRHLVHITQRDPNRGQSYANCIQELQFGHEGASRNFAEEARYHKDLAVLQFPNLLKVGFYGFEDAMPMNSGPAVLHYAQPLVTEFVLGNASQISDSFLDILGVRCATLKRFDLDEITESSLTEDGVVRFIDNAHSLTALDIRLGRKSSGWTLNEFKATAKHLNLELLIIPDIPDDWLEFLRRDSPIQPSFPKMLHFTTGTSDQALQLLAPYMPTLESLELKLQNLSPSHHILASASLFTHLKSLEVNFGTNSSIDANDLVLLAKGCPQLIEFSVCKFEDENHRPSGRGITDNAIEEMAQHMQNIAKLYLAFDRSNMLSWQSILSLARKCRNLRLLRLSCNFTWKEAMDNAQANAFPELRSLTLYLDEANRLSHLTDDGREEETIEAFAAKFTAFAPQLGSIYLEGKNTTDEALADAIDVICSSRSIPG